jgi:hypothetical protein
LNLLETALAYRQSGLSVLPAYPKQKRPALRSWREYQRQLPSPESLKHLFRTADGLCVLCGAVSGNLEILDFDHQGEMFTPWCELVDSVQPGLRERLVVERSPSGGYHVIYRCHEPVPGNRKLAQRKIVGDAAEAATNAESPMASGSTSRSSETTCVLIETRGEGGLFLCDPTPGYCLQQGDLCALPVLEAAEHAVLVDAARALDELTPVLAPVPVDAIENGRPGDDYNHRGDVVQLLTLHGWTCVRSGSREYWRRPGKDTGWSASRRDSVFYVFSSNAAPFEPERGYAPFHVYTLLEHQGDFASAARTLRAEGFGDLRPATAPGVDLTAMLTSELPSGPTTSGPAPVDPGPLPVELLRAPGFISLVMDECLATAPYPNPVMAFSGALALLAFLAGRKVRDPGDNRTNLYLLGLANSSAGKDWPRKLNTRILHAIGLADCLGEQFASGEGIQDMLRLHPSSLFQTDEIDGILQSINKSRDARYENVMSTLLTLYSSANTVFPLRRKAGKKPAGVIDQPCLTILGTAIPNHYYEALSERMLTNGFFARMLILECGRRGDGQEPSIRDLPPAIVETARWWHEFQPGSGNLKNWHPEPVVVPHTDEARRLLTAARTEAEAEYRRAEERNDAVGTTVWGRVSEHTRKLALLYAISENHVAPEIVEAAVSWATQIVLHQTRRMLFMAQSHVADNPFHGNCLKFLRKLREAPSRTLPHSVLLRRMKMDARTFRETAATLEQWGSIRVEAKATAGRTGHWYTLSEDAGSAQLE